MRWISNTARDWVIVENHHQPTTIHQRTYVDKRYKITVYYNRDYGELFDLEEDPGEINNLWDDSAHADKKAELLDVLREWRIRSALHTANWGAEWR